MNDYAYMFCVYAWAVEHAHVLIFLIVGASGKNKNDLNVHGYGCI